MVLKILYFVYLKKLASLHNYNIYVLIEKFFEFYFCIGQIGFVIILIFFFYYFSIILIIVAEINFYFFEEYLPLENSFGTYLNQISQKYPNDKQQQSTMTNINQYPKIKWINKYGSSKKQYNIEPQLDKNNNI